MKHRWLILALVALCAGLCAAQPEQQPVDPKTPQILVGNAEVKVLKYELRAGETLKLAAALTDRALVLPKDVSYTVAGGVTKTGAVAGDVVFVAKDHKMEVRSGQSQSTPQIVFEVDFLRYWENELRPCDDAVLCARPIRVGLGVIGETRRFFTNGFVSAYRHLLDRGGTLASSYYTTQGTDHVVLIALSRLQANFGTDEVQLEPNQVYFSTVQDIEIATADEAAQWVVFRIHAGKTSKAH